MSNCFSCGASLKSSEHDLLQLFKRDYLENGVERYFYKTSEKGDVKVIKKAYFSKLFELEIKPNFKNGSQYAHIKEYKETSLIQKP